MDDVASSDEKSPSRGRRGSLAKMKKAMAAALGMSSTWQSGDESPRTPEPASPSFEVGRAEDALGPALQREQCSKLVAAAAEIVRTEGDYLSVLHTLTTGYIPRLAPSLEADEKAMIFSNAETMLGVHTELHARLERAQALPTLRQEIGAIAVAFTTMMPFLKLYANYCANYVNALDALEHARSGRPAFASAIQRAEVEIATHRQGEGDLRLSSCLIRPVKRLCLYPLLLTALLKEFTSAEDTAAAATAATADASAAASSAATSTSALRDTLSRTAEAVQEMAFRVNSMVQEAEHRVHMMELHERLRGLYPGLISPTRRLVRTDRVHLRKYLLRRAGEEGLHEKDALPARKKYDAWLLTDRVLLTRPERSGRTALPFLKIKEDLPLGDVHVSWTRPHTAGVLTRSMLSNSTPVEGDELPTSFWLWRGELDRKQPPRSSITGSHGERSTSLYHVHCDERAAAERLYAAYEAQVRARRESESARIQQRARLTRGGSLTATWKATFRRLTSKEGALDSHGGAPKGGWVDIPLDGSALPTELTHANSLLDDGTLRRAEPAGDMLSSLSISLSLKRAGRSFIRSLHGGHKSSIVSRSYGKDLTAAVPKVGAPAARTASPAPRTQPADVASASAFAPEDDGDSGMPPALQSLDSDSQSGDGDTSFAPRLTAIVEGSMRESMMSVGSARDSRAFFTSEATSESNTERETYGRRTDGSEYGRRTDGSEDGAARLPLISESPSAERHIGDALNEASVGEDSVRSIISEDPLSLSQIPICSNLAALPLPPMPSFREFDSDESLAELSLSVHGPPLGSSQPLPRAPPLLSQTVASDLERAHVSPLPPTRRGVPASEVLPNELADRHDLPARVTLARQTSLLATRRGSAEDQLLAQLNKLQMVAELRKSNYDERRSSAVTRSSGAQTASRSKSPNSPPQLTKLDSWDEESLSDDDDEDDVAEPSVYIEPNQRRSSDVRVSTKSDGKRTAHRGTITHF